MTTVGGHQPHREHVWEARSPASLVCCKLLLMQAVLHNKTASAISRSSNVSPGFKETKGYFTGKKVCRYTLYYHVASIHVIHAAGLGLE